MKEREEPRKTFVHVRGNFFGKKARKSTPATPAILPPLPDDQPPNRLALARWLVRADNPLTARVTVNRIWERFFGTGIVKTSAGFRQTRRGAVASRTAGLARCEFMQPGRLNRHTFNAQPPHAWT